MQHFPQSITVFGVGLIGGSLALALKRALPGVHILGIDRPDVLKRAQDLKILDHGIELPGNLSSTATQPFDKRFAEALLHSDLVILATPIGEILRLLDQFSGHATLVLDVGSTKVTICRKAERLGVPFIGGHPMAGLEQSGPEAATPDLFTAAPFFLCPVKSTPAGGLDQAQAIASAINAVPHIITPEEHDRMVACISHLPQIISTLLADQTSADRKFAGPGLKSMTRLAGSPFHIWRDIFKTSGFLPQEIQSFIQRLQRVLDSIEGGHLDEIEGLFKRGGSV